MRFFAGGVASVGQPNEATSTVRIRFLPALAGASACCGAAGLSAVRGVIGREVEAIGRLRSKVRRDGIGKAAIVEAARRAACRAGGRSCTLRPARARAVTGA